MKKIIFSRVDLWDTKARLIRGAVRQHAVRCEIHNSVEAALKKRL